MNNRLTSKIREGPLLTKFGGSWVQPLHYAITRNNQDMARFLVLQKAAKMYSISGNSSTPLSCAIEEGILEMIEFFLECGYPVSGAPGHKLAIPLHCAATSNRSEDGRIIKLLLNAGAKVDQKDSNGATPLMTAAKSKFMRRPTYIPPFHTLLEAGADVNAKDNDGNTALHYATRIGINSAFITVLLQYGAD
ncbi:hypothetical protein H072_6054 [Dactylellina haptotyla CBS 200.50]|uniref:Uncharacterized protein n=1 Tax=Dactylellina haptotyla (strain CBS 200.50) TaxID=1284197 RepID=S8AB14_DACHA|nr:hypothetical protein H072_6054 [Dactylellina haptotyla CBS 200.50]